MKIQEVDTEICNGKRIYTTWDKASSVMKKMLKEKGHRKVSLHVYRCGVSNQHFHVGSTYQEQYSRNWKPGSKARYNEHKG